MLALLDSDLDDRRPYRALYMIRRWPSNGPNSGPAQIHTFSSVLASRYAFPISVAYASIPLSSARKMHMRSPRRETTPEYTLSSGTSVRCPYCNTFCNKGIASQERIAIYIAKSKHNSAIHIGKF